MSLPDRGRLVTFLRASVRVMCEMRLALAAAIYRVALIAFDAGVFKVLGR